MTRAIAIPTRPTPGHWLDAADQALVESMNFRLSGNFTLAQLRLDDAKFCQRQARLQMTGDAA